MNKQFAMRWAGSYTFISCSYWARHYSTVLNRILGKGLETAVFIHKKGVVSFYLEKEELSSYGKYLADKLHKDEAGSLELLDKLKQNTDILLSLMDKLDGKVLSITEYNEFLSAFERHLGYHVFMKKTVDFLCPEDLEKHLQKFRDARLYSEKVYSRTESFFRSLAKAIALKEGHDADLLTCLTQEEIESYLNEGSLPSKSVLHERFEESAIQFNHGLLKISVGKDAKKVEQEVTMITSTKTITGVVACPGKIRGIVRLVLDPFVNTPFNEGEILVTGMTRPEYMPYIAKASAIITDAGGVLCHAAITAREMKKVCVVGTEVATKVLKDGDVIEVDGEIIRKV